MVWGEEKWTAEFMEGGLDFPEPEPDKMAQRGARWGTEQPEDCAREIDVSTSGMFIHFGTV